MPGNPRPLLMAASGTKIHPDARPLPRLRPDACLRGAPACRTGLQILLPPHAGLPAPRAMWDDAGAVGHPDGGREVLVEGTAAGQACPGCGVVSGRVHSRAMQRVKDLPYGRPLTARWRKRRSACDEPSCRRRTFAEHNMQVGPRRRLTRRLRE